jgi:hypothetical protein
VHSVEDANDCIIPTATYKIGSATAVATTVHVLFHFNQQWVFLETIKNLKGLSSN